MCFMTMIRRSKRDAFIGAKTGAQQGQAADLGQDVDSVLELLVGPDRRSLVGHVVREQLLQKETCAAFNDRRSMTTIGNLEK